MDRNGPRLRAGPLLRRRGRVEVTDLDRLASALDRARVDADELELCEQRERLVSTRFAGSRILQSIVSEEVVVQARAATDGRVGAARGSPHDPSAIARLAGEAARTARTTLAPAHVGFATPAPLPATPDAFVAETAELRPGDHATMLAVAFVDAAARGLSCAGNLATMAHSLTVANSRGVRLTCRSTECRLSLLVGPAEATGYATFYGRAARELDLAALVARAAGGAALARDPIALPPGPYDVLLEPPAVAEVLEWLALTAFGGQAALEGTSFLDQPGRGLTSEHVSWSDAPDAPFDPEGTPRQPVSFVERGRAGRPCFDLRTAAHAGTRSTGHAPPLGRMATTGPIPLAVAMAPGEHPTEELVRRLDRGLIVTRFHYVNGLSDPRRAVQTGMTRDGLAWVEHGRVRGGARNLRFSEAMLDAFSRMEGHGRERQAVATHWIGGGAFLVPTVLIRGFCFTGTQ
jgi:predicted Zn-dependent protease